MATNTAGDSARLFPWEVSHYIVRGGPNDPVLPSVSNAGGILSFNGSFVAPPFPGFATPNPMQLIGTTTAGSTSLTTNNGGVLIGTLPKGAWITVIELFCAAALSGGTATSIGFYGVTADSAYPKASVSTLAYITSPSANVVYSTRGANGGATAFTGVSATLVGPQLCLSNDIDLYVINWLIAGSGTVNTAGDFSCMIEFTGLEG